MLRLSIAQSVNHVISFLGVGWTTNRYKSFRSLYLLLCLVVLSTPCLKSGNLARREKCDRKGKHSSKIRGELRETAAIGDLARLWTEITARVLDRTEVAPAGGAIKRNVG
jgi:hypothetical protein